MSAEHREDPLEDVALRWRHLAKFRLAYYIELLASGRWRHYCADEKIFAARMLDMIKAARARVAGRQTAASEATGPANHDELRPAT